MWASQMMKKEEKKIIGHSIFVTLISFALQFASQVFSFLVFLEVWGPLMAPAYRVPSPEINAFFNYGQLQRVFRWHASNRLPRCDFFNGRTFRLQITYPWLISLFFRVPAPGGGDRSDVIGLQPTLVKREDCWPVLTCLVPVPRVS